MLAVFFVFGTAMAALAGVSLLVPDLGLGWMWAFKRAEYEQMRSLGTAAGGGFLLLSLLLATAAAGCARRRRWEWSLGVLLISINAAGDAARAFAGHFLDGFVGIVLAGFLLLWLLRREVRSEFGA